MKPFLLLFLIGLLLQGCQTDEVSGAKRLSRWILPSEFRSVASDTQLESVFDRYEGSATIHRVEVDKSCYAVVRLHPKNGGSFFPCLVYEKIDPQLWHLRGCFWFYFSHSGEITMEKETNGLFLVHDGKRLFKILSAAEQENRQRLAR